MPCLTFSNFLEGNASIFIWLKSSTEENNAADMIVFLNI